MQHKLCDLNTLIHTAGKYDEQLVDTHAAASLTLPHGYPSMHRDLD